MSLEANSELDDLYTEMENDSLQGFWRVARDLRTQTPQSPAVPYRWPWSKVRVHLDRAAGLVTIERGAERRTILLVNPGLKARHLTTPTIAASVQIIRPGEIAPAHRHSGTAIRFVIEGAGAFTAVSGELIYMEERDLILTPSLTWHNHGNETPRPIIWMDGIDAPLMVYLGSQFSEEYPSDEQETLRPSGYTVKKYGAGTLRPSSEHTAPGVSPLWHYRWKDVYPALVNLAEVELDPFDGAMLDYTNPLTGRHALPSMACRVQLLPAGTATAAHRHTGHFVYHVVQGSGATTIDGVRYPWRQGDFFLVPPWRWHKHESAAEQDAILFSLSDLPLLDALGVYKEEALVDEAVTAQVEEKVRELVRV